jgi:hypothetical protein
MIANKIIACFFIERALFLKRKPYFYISEYHFSYRLFLLTTLLTIVSSFSGVCRAGELDKSKYIGIEEIKDGMKGYCLTCFKGTEVEKFELEVVSTVKNMNPGRDAIIIQSTDERFIHAGLIGGVSGSPVYIDGRLAGAMSFGWPNSKDPVYGVTPIKDMLSVGTETNPAGKETKYSAGFDFSRPLNVLDLSKSFQRLPEQKSASGSDMPQLPCQIITAGLTDSAIRQLNQILDSHGLITVTASGGGGAAITEDYQAQTQDKEGSKLAPGSPLIIPMVFGDIIVALTGTVTEVVGDKIYGFGHGFLGYGPVDLPIATGEVHTVVASNVRSFKLASPLEIVGALREDQDSGVIGQIGVQAYMFPVSVKVDRYNDTQQRIFTCKVANNRLYTPGMVGIVISGAAMYLGDFPPDNMIEYKVTINTKQAEPITFENVSTGTGVSEVFAETMNSIKLLMNNPFKEAQINSVDVEIKIKPKNIVSHIWSVEASDTRVNPGEKIRLDVVVEAVLEPKKRYSFEMTIPEDLKPGTYEVTICGTEQYVNLLEKLAPHRFLAQNFDTLIEAMREILSFERDDLYCVLILPASGIVLEKAELADLPATKAMVLTDSKRALVAQPLKSWQQQKLKTNTIVIDRKSLQINVVEE